MPDWDTRPVNFHNRLGYGTDRHWEYKLLRNYGLEAGEYFAILESQGGGCAICGTSACASGKRLAVDHDHKTGTVRGILCGHCNQAIGKLGETVENFLGAIIYLIYLLKHQVDYRPV